MGQKWISKGEHTLIEIQVEPVLIYTGVGEIEVIPLKNTMGI